MKIPLEYANRIAIAENGCWTWTGWIMGVRGTTGTRAPYGVIQRNKKILRAHRYFYELATGVCPGSLTVHHKCRNTLCVNPDHLEALPRATHNRLHAPEHPQNAAKLARETCSHGHPWTEESTYWYKGTRSCRPCGAETMRRSRKARGLDGKPKQRCPQGHPYDGDNLYVGPDGARRCRACNRARYWIGKTRRKAGADV